MLLHCGWKCLCVTPSSQVLALLLSCEQFNQRVNSSFFRGLEELKVDSISNMRENSEPIYVSVWVSYYTHRLRATVPDCHCTSIWQVRCLYFTAVASCGI